jgi:uncharacterized repeat protein (TIGR01451 family)
MKHTLHARVVLICLTITVLTTPLYQPAEVLESQAALPQPLAQQAAVGDITYKIEWTDQATDAYSWAGTTFFGYAQSATQQTIENQGDAIVRAPAAGGIWSAPSLNLLHTNTKSFSDSERDGCIKVNERRWVTDPASEMGRSIAAVNFLPPTQHPDGSWHMRDPADLLVAGASFRWPFHLDHREITCVSGQHDYATDGYDNGADFAFRPIPDLAGNATGTQFTGRLSYTDDTAGHHWLVERTIKVTRLGACASSGAAILDASDPRVNHLELISGGIDHILPGEETTVAVQVLCDSVPIKNAEIQIGVKPQFGSGGHFHDQDDRPRGYLDDVKITRVQPAITRRTDNQGFIEIRLAPGKDTQDEAIGIAGDYDITFTPVAFPDAENQFRVEVGYRNFVEVSSSEGIETVGYQTKHLLGNTYATGTTSLRLKQLAANFREFLGNQLGILQCDQWPPKLAVNDISLPNGGLFDVLGWDARAGKVRGQPWQPPHYTHVDGTVVDFSLAPTSPCLGPWRSELIQLGRGYGTWIGGATLTLRFNQGGATPTRPTSTASGPDLGVVAFLSSREIPAVAPGQTVTYTVGVNNLNGAVAAHNVALTATLPAGLTFVSADPAPASPINPEQPVWEMGTITTTQRSQLASIVARVNPGIAPGSVLTVTANASTTDAETDLTDNHDEAFGLLVQPIGPDLVVESDLAGVPMTVDQPITTTIDVTNYGNVASPDATLSLTLPPSVTLLSAVPFTPTINAAGLTWNLGVLAPEAMRRITLTLRPDLLLATSVSFNPEVVSSKLLTYTLNAATSGPDIDPANNTATMAGPVASTGNDAQVWLHSAATRTGGISTGQDLTYTIRYANYGNQTAPTTTVTLTLGSGLVLLSSQPAATRIISGTKLGWDLGDLPVGMTGEFQVRARVDAALPEGTVTAATINSTAYDIAPLNNVAQDWRPVIVAALTQHIYLPLVTRTTH